MNQFSQVDTTALQTMFLFATLIGRSVSTTRSGGWRVTNRRLPQAVPTCSPIQTAADTNIRGHPTGSVLNREVVNTNIKPTKRCQA